MGVAPLPGTDFASMIAGKAASRNQRREEEQQGMLRSSTMAGTQRQVLTLLFNFLSCLVLDLLLIKQLYWPVEEGAILKRVKKEKLLVLVITVIHQRCPDELTLDHHPLNQYHHQPHPDQVSHMIST